MNNDLTCQSTKRTLNSTACLGVICGGYGGTVLEGDAGGREGGPGHPAGTWGGNL